MGRVQFGATCAADVSGVFGRKKGKLPMRFGKIATRFLILTALTFPSLISCGGGGGDEDTPQPVPITETLLSRNPRGIVGIQCQHPNAHAQCAVLADIAIRAGIDQPASIELVDGSFGAFNAEITNAKIRRMAQGGRRPWIGFYLGDGPAQRRFKSTKLNGFHTRTDPAKYRKLIQHDGPTREKFKSQVVQPLLPTIDLVNELNGTVVLVYGGLEDNLDRDSSNAQWQLAKEVVGDHVVKWARNPCKCYDGADDYVPPGVMRERHTDSDNFPTTNGIITNDGNDWRSIKDAEQSLDHGAKNGVAWFYWRSDFQGFSEPPQAADDRHYYTPGPAEQEELVNLLRR